MPAAERRFSAAAIAALAIAPWLYFWRGARMEVLLGEGETFVQNLSNWAWGAAQWRAGTPPLWSPYLFAGSPFFAEPQTTIFHPLQLLFMALPPLEAVNLVVLAYHGVAGVSTYLLARQHGLTIGASAVGGVVYMFCGFLLLHQGMTAILMTAASMPVLLCAIGRARRRPGWGSCCLVALAVLHLVLTGHLQFTFYAFACGAAYGGWLLWSAPGAERRAFARTALAGGALGLALGTVQILPTAELLGYSIRDRLIYESFAGPAYSPPLMLASLLSIRMTTVLPINGTEGALNVGALPLLLAGFGIALRTRAAAFWIGLLAVSALLWMGDWTPLYKAMYHVPGYNLFRIATRNGVLVDFAIAMLAAFGVDALVRSRGSLPARWRWGLLALVPVAVVFGWQQPGERVFKYLWKVNSVKRIQMSWEAFERHLTPLAPSLALLAAAAVAIALCLWWGRGGRAVAALCLVLTMVHFWHYRNWLFLAPAAEVRRSLEPDALAAPLRPPPGSSPAPYRIAHGGPTGWINFFLADRPTWRARYVAAGGVGVNALHGVPSIGGYSSLMLRDYSRLAGDMRLFGGVGDPALFRSAALDLLDVRFVAVPAGKLGFPPETFAGLVPAGEADGLTVYKNPGALGTAWAVEEVEAAGDGAAWAAVTGETFDPRRTALLGPADAARLGAGPGEGGARRFARPDRLAVRWVDCNTIEAEVEAPGEVFLAVSLVHYPGWRATVDGERVPLLKANGVLTGLVVPAGGRRVVLAYRPASLRWGLLCAGLAAAAMAAGTAVSVRRRRRAAPAGPTTPSVPTPAG